MGNCKFANELNRLRKSSSDSIDNTEKFDDFKIYACNKNCRGRFKRDS